MPARVLWTKWRTRGVSLEDPKYVAFKATGAIRQTSCQLLPSVFGDSFSRKGQKFLLMLPKTHRLGCSRNVCSSLCVLAFPYIHGGSVPQIQKPDTRNPVSGAPHIDLFKCSPQKKMFFLYSRGLKLETTVAGKVVPGMNGTLCSARNTALASVSSHATCEHSFAFHSSLKCFASRATIPMHAYLQIRSVQLSATHA